MTTKSKLLSRFYVSRQVQWPDGEHVVEIAQGGLDYCNPGMLTPHRALKPLGEGREYVDPVEAVEAAIAVRKGWIELLTASGKDVPEIGIGMGFTGGGTMPFSPTSDEDLMKRAEALRETMPKCSRCGDLLSGEHFTLPDDPFDDKFCSAECAEREADDRAANETQSLAESEASTQDLTEEDVEDIP